MARVPNSFHPLLLLLALALLPAASAKLTIPGLTHIHYDVEPHTLSEWTLNPASVGAQYVLLLASLQNTIQAGGVAIGLSVSMNCDMDGAQCGTLPGCNITLNGKVQPISSHALEQVNKTVMMAYFKSTSEILTRVDSEARKAASSGVEFAVALNLEPTPPAIKEETFQDEGIAQMEAAFDNVSSTLKPLFGKDVQRVIHHYGSFHPSLSSSSSSSPSPSSSASFSSLSGYYAALTPAATRELYWWCSAGTGVDCDIYNPASVASWISFARSHGVTGVYLDAPAIVKLGPSGDQKLLINVIGQFFAHGIHTELIFGKHSWALTANHAEALSYANSVVNMIKFYGQQEAANTTLPPFNCSTASTSSSASTPSPKLSPSPTPNSESRIIASVFLVLVAVIRI